MSVSAFVMIFLGIVIFSFYLAFERSHPSAGELVIAAQLCALCICVRAVFSFVPYFNPVMALIMLSSVQLGVRKGFLLGSLSAFGSNFIFGQGPWTLYQMTSWGMAGVIFALLAKCSLLRRTEWKIKDYIAACFCAAVTIIFITGPLADLSGVFMFGVNDFKGLVALLAGGFFLNVSLALSAVITIILIARPVLFALNRTTSSSAPL